MLGDFRLPNPPRITFITPLSIRRFGPPFPAVRSAGATLHPDRTGGTVRPGRPPICQSGLHPASTLSLRWAGNGAAGETHDRDAQGRRGRRWRRAHRRDAERRGGDADRDAGQQRPVAADAPLLRRHVAGGAGSVGAAARASRRVRAERLSGALPPGPSRALAGGPHDRLGARLLGPGPAGRRHQGLGNARLLRRHVPRDPGVRFGARRDRPHAHADRDPDGRGDDRAR